MRDEKRIVCGDALQRTPLAQHEHAAGAERVPLRRAANGDRGGGGGGAQAEARAEEQKKEKEKEDEEEKEEEEEVDERSFLHVSLSRSSNCIRRHEIEALLRALRSRATGGQQGTCAAAAAVLRVECDAVALLHSERRARSYVALLVCAADAARLRSAAVARVDDACDALGLCADYARRAAPHVSVASVPSSEPAARAFAAGSAGGAGVAPFARIALQENIQVELDTTLHCIIGHVCYEIK